jgi:hypothetical protein
MHETQNSVKYYLIKNRLSGHTLHEMSFDLYEQIQLPKTHHSISIFPLHIIRSGCFTSLGTHPTGISER